MANIDYNITQILEQLFEMNTGYVMDFSNRTFERFVYGNIWLRIYSDPWYEEPCSKAKKLRQIIKNENNEKVYKLINSLIDYYENMKLKSNKLTDYDNKLIGKVRLYLKNNAVKNSSISEDLNKKIQLVSIRNEKFEEMPKDEKLKTVVDLIEYFLKEDWKFKSLDFEQFSRWFISEDSIKQFRKLLQCFRHSSKESLIERNTFSEEEKNFFIEYWVAICIILNSLENAS